jgi:hypothetical protein
MKERQSAVYWLRQPLPGSLFIAVDKKTDGCSWSRTSRTPNPANR